MRQAGPHFQPVTRPVKGLAQYVLKQLQQYIMPVDSCWFVCASCSWCTTYAGLTVTPGTDQLDHTWKNTCAASQTMPAPTPRMSDLTRGSRKGLSSCLLMDTAATAEPDAARCAAASSVSACTCMLTVRQPTISVKALNTQYKSVSAAYKRAMMSCALSKTSPVDDQRHPLLPC